MHSIFKQGLHLLLKWYERQKRVLPWRSEPTLYRVWISEIMLQQTQVATVIPYFERFLRRFPTVNQLAEAPLEEVLRYWAGLGYYTRAKNIHKAAIQFVQAGGFPCTREQWLEVPGVGPYTAGAVLSIALDQPEAILDGNVERVLSRLWRVGGAKTKTKGHSVENNREIKKKLWDLSHKMVVQGFSKNIRPSQLNQALMELGATVCLPKNPQCQQCPLRPLCQGFRKKDAAFFPLQRVRAKTVSLSEKKHCVLNDKGQALLQQTPPGKWRAGLWDFLDHPLNIININNLKIVGVYETNHVVTHHKIRRTTSVWKSDCPNTIKGPHKSRWVSLKDPQVPVGSPFHKVVKLLP